MAEKDVKKTDRREIVNEEGNRNREKDEQEDSDCESPIQYFWSDGDDVDSA